MKKFEVRDRERKGTAPIHAPWECHRSQTDNGKRHKEYGGKGPGNRSRSTERDSKHYGRKSKAGILPHIVLSRILNALTCGAHTKRTSSLKPPARNGEWSRYWSCYINPPLWSESSGLEMHLTRPTRYVYSQVCTVVETVKRSSLTCQLRTDEAWTRVAKSTLYLSGLLHKLVTWAIQNE